MINLSQETEALAERLAATQSLSVEGAVRLRSKRKRAVPELPWNHGDRAINPPKQSPRGHARTNRFVTELAAMSVRDPRSPRDIMYDLNAL